VPNAPISLCREQAISNKIKTAKDVASPALKAAQAAVRDPSFDTSTANAVMAAAEQALLALTQITNTLNIGAKP
jgi:hypothetical protein